MEWVEDEFPGARDQDEVVSRGSSELCQVNNSAIAALEAGECIDTSFEGQRRRARQCLHRGSCLYIMIYVTIDSDSKPELSSLGDGSHRGQSNR